MAGTWNQGHSGLHSGSQDSLNYDRRTHLSKPIFLALHCPQRKSPDTLSLTQTLLPIQSAQQTPFVPDRHGFLPLISKPLCLCAFCQMLSSLPSKLHFCLAQLKRYPLLWVLHLCPADLSPLSAAMLVEIISINYLSPG